MDVQKKIEELKALVTKDREEDDAACEALMAELFGHAILCLSRSAAALEKIAKIQGDTLMMQRGAER